MLNRRRKKSICYEGKYLYVFIYIYVIDLSFCCLSSGYRPMLEINNTIWNFSNNRIK